MSKRLTWNEICKKYPNQWVGLSNVYYDEKDCVVSGNVVCFNESYNSILEQPTVEPFHTSRVGGIIPINSSFDVQLTWNEICDKYPNQWVGLTDIVRDNSWMSIESAKVKYVGLSYDELTYLYSVKNLCKVFPTSDTVIEPLGGPVLCQVSM